MEEKNYADEFVNLVTREKQIEEFARWLDSQWEYYRCGITTSIAESVIGREDYAEVARKAFKIFGERARTVMAMNKNEYPPDWYDMSRRIRFKRAGGKCEGSPRYPECRAEHNKQHPVTGSLVVLTTAHLDHDKTNNTEENLRALCQRCHLDHDRYRHVANASHTRVEKKESAGQIAMAKLDEKTAEHLRKSWKKLHEGPERRPPKE